MQYEVLAAPGVPVVFGATGLSEIAQNIRMLLATEAWSCPLDRAFTSAVGYLDSPLPLVTAARMAEVIAAVEANEPRVRVTSVNFVSDPAAALEGRLYPKVRFALREGVSL
jgi:phage baseplate assembly protein W